MRSRTSISKAGWFKLKIVAHSKSQFYRLLTVILLLAPSLHAQSKMDSLHNLLREIRGVTRAEILLELSTYTRQNNVEKAIRQVEEALAIAERRDDEELQSKCLRQLGFYHSIIDQDTTALKNYLEALKMERRHGHRLDQANVLLKLGRFYALQDNHAKALNYYFQSLRISQAEDAKRSTAQTMMYIGNAYRERKSLNQAISFYSRASKLARQTGDQRTLTMAAAKAGINLHKIEKFDEATLYFEQALNAAKALHSIHAQAGILLAMSSAYKDQNLYEKALILNKKQLKIADSHESKILHARGFENLAGIYKANGNTGRSNVYLLKANALYKKLAMPVIPVAVKLMQNYLQQGRAPKAIQTGEQVLKQVKESASPQNKKVLLETLIQAYTKRGNYQKAFQLQNELIAVNTNIFDRDKSQQIAEMQARYETGRKEQQIALLQKKQENAELLRNALIIGLVLILIIAFLIYKRQRLKIKKNKTDLENTRLKEQQLKQDIDFKNKQLTTHSLHLVQKNENLKELKQHITAIQNNSNGKTDKKLRNLQNMVDYSFNLDEDWDEFKHYFEEVHTGFFKALKEHSPHLTTNELRLSALVKLNLTIKEIATIMNISPDSVKTARYRLRKKLDMDSDKNLTYFMMNIEKEAINRS